MSRLSRKLILRITLALCVVFVLSFAVNTYILPKYVIYQEKHKLSRLTSELASMEYGPLLEQMEAIEKHNQVTIAYVPLSESINDLNSNLLEHFKRKGITLSKFWLTEESIKTLREGGRVNKLYDQNKLKSSFLVNFLPIGGSVFAIGESISHTSDVIRIVNRLNVYVWCSMLLVLIALAAVYTSRIVRPLAKLNETAEAISYLSFTRADIRTGDEIEMLANSINRMSERLKDAHDTLETRNANLRTFIADISHELKTPLSLIRVYAAGLEDGLDNGTYANVIRQQSEEMALLLDRLLELSRLQAEAYRLEPVDLRLLLSEVLEVYQAAFRQQEMELVVDNALHEATWVNADRKKLESVLHNWLMNAMKYTSDKRARVTIGSKGGEVHFCIANATDTAPNASWDKVWEPFFVMDKSRSKKFSGTGLGLSLTRIILENHHAFYGLKLQDQTVEFYFTLPLLNGSS